MLEQEVVKGPRDGFGEDRDDNAVGPDNEGAQRLAQEGVQPQPYAPRGRAAAKRIAKVQVEVDQGRPPAVKLDILQCCTCMISVNFIITRKGLCGLKC